MNVVSDSEIQERIKSVEDVCKEHGQIDFSPMDGVCYRCKRNVYQNYQIGDRVSRGRSGKEPITGCPHCFYSFCD